MVRKESTTTSSKIQEKRRRIQRLMKNFKPHMMYDKSGKGYKAETYEQHLAMKNKGYGHTKPSTKKKAKKIIRKRSKPQSGY
tara:strand:+ start:20 stop:265 length:246 start_codon:yes stop_codon:yes gene_type:complete